MLRRRARLVVTLRRRGSGARRRLLLRRGPRRRDLLAGARRDRRIFVATLGAVHGALRSRVPGAILLTVHRIASGSVDGARATTTRHLAEAPPEEDPEEEDEDRDPGVDPLPEDVVGRVAAHALDDDAPDGIAHDVGGEHLARLQGEAPADPDEEGREEQAPDGFVEEGRVEVALDDGVARR